MKRSDMIDEMIKFHKSTPQEASDYHRFDMMLSRMERLGMLPPYTEEANIWDCEWEPEDD